MKEETCDFLWNTKLNTVLFRKNEITELENVPIVSFLISINIAKVYWDTLFFKRIG